MNTAQKVSTNSMPRILKLIKGQEVDRTPIWFMRQAGRYLPEYLEIRSKHSMLECIQNPEIAVEITLQPLRRFELDAAIIFADILNPLIGMGIELDFIKGAGPKIFNPIKTAEDVAKLKVPENYQSVAGTLEALKTISQHKIMEDKTLIGFAGAPFTLSAYILEGESSDKLQTTKKWAYQNPKAWHELQEKLSAYLIGYLLEQVSAGAELIQIFDSWLGHLSPSDYRELVEPYLHKICDALKKETSIPITFFATGCSSLFSEFKHLNIDVLGVDWRMDLATASRASEKKFILQGNLDPLTLFAPEEKIIKETKRILAEAKDIKGHIFNLGHGILPETPITSIETVIKTLINDK